ncbi:MAG: hypothetical protein GTO45_05165 [Candidatus Aminicenantes bacterium]|nr:hypothetical protein [Candidatus Aminicenantes bacterium]NIM78141.1 hypothetical protein [Candidatus Aminicenantes bacterium]NIN17461.1 hypothetical protein [Candidatus Aminicenantes bacterium]NIN41357.1 hypothetical protein [Candidatus Aminicenantes bacterium]NIN84127.1 hypothetical protein [Candidatus Aminicenantes bacterium]
MDSIFNLPPYFLIDSLNNILTWIQHEKKHLKQKFLRGPGGTYSAVLMNTHGDDTSFEASYAVLALQMLPHAVGFF